MWQSLYFSRRKSWYEHWVCWMSTGRKNTHLWLMTEGSAHIQNFDKRENTHTPVGMYVPGHWLPDALLRGRNIWVKMTILRNTRFLARNICCLRRKKLLCALKKKWSTFFLNRLRRKKCRPLFLFAVSKNLSLFAVGFCSFLGLFPIRRSRKNLKGSFRYSVFAVIFV